RDGGHERRHRHAAHAGEDHRDVDAEEVADRCAERPGGHFTLTGFARPWESATGSTRHMPMPAERRRIQPVLIGGGQTIDRPEDPTARALGRAGRRIPWTPPRAEDAPRWGDGRPGSSELEIRHGAAQPIATYPLFENAFRAARGLDLEAHRRELGAFAARCAALAAE